MFFAVDASGTRIAPSPTGTGTCPICSEALRPRCGRIRVWHWAHVARLNCDPWDEHETEWHRAWKLLAPPDRVEVSRGEHRADIVAKDGAVIELQHSPISVDEILARERFYGKMLWLIDGAPMTGAFRVELAGPKPRFIWRPARPSWLASHVPKFIHGFEVGTHVRQIDPVTGRIRSVWQSSYTSSDLFQIQLLKSQPFVHGTGRIVAVQDMVDRLIAD